MFLTKLTVDPRSSAFRRDVANVHDMHRTLMSAYPETADPETADPAAVDAAPAGTDPAYRQAHGVLWRLDPVRSGFVQYVQSRTTPDWTRLPDGHLLRPAEVRSLQPVLDSIEPGRRFAFRLLANPTRCVRRDDGTGRGRRVPHRDPAKQVEWLVGKGEQHGFVIPTGRQGGPAVAATPVPTLTGTRRHSGRITVEPVRFDGHLVVIDPAAFTEALVTGIGRAKAYGCGLLTLAPPNPTT